MSVNSSYIREYISHPLKMFVRFTAAVFISLESTRRIYLYLLLEHFYKQFPLNEYVTLLLGFKTSITYK